MDCILPLAKTSIAMYIPSKLLSLICLQLQLDVSELCLFLTPPRREEDAPSTLCLVDEKRRHSKVTGTGIGSDIWLEVQTSWLC